MFSIIVAVLFVIKMKCCLTSAINFHDITDTAGNPEEQILTDIIHLLKLIYRNNLK